MYPTRNPILNRLDAAERKLKSNTSDMQALEKRVTEIEQFIESVGMILSGEARDADPDGLQTRIDDAISVIMNKGCHDGGHHKQYALDQALRILAGERYDEIVREWEAGEDGPKTYEWGTGIPA